MNEIDSNLEKYKKHLIVIINYVQGLTATLIREDSKIEDLNYMIGPKLYEENWLDLVNDGYLARPYCVEVRCPMTRQFLKAYKDNSRNEIKRLLYGGNPNKFLALQYLINKHEERGDKIIVFGDKLFLLNEYGRRLKIAVAHGGVSHEERVAILDHFQRTKNINTIILSSIGDTAIDLPIANVVIQISSHFGSRRQEAQRLGRIMRPKENHVDQFNAFFYTLVSLETDETLYAAKRQRFLIDQGFSFEIVTELEYMNNPDILKKLQMHDLESQQNHLSTLLQYSMKNEKVQDKRMVQEVQQTYLFFKIIEAYQDIYVYINRIIVLTLIVILMMIKIQEQMKYLIHQIEIR